MHVQVPRHARAPAIRRREMPATCHGCAGTAGRRTMRHPHTKVRLLSQWAQCTHFQRVRALLHVHTRSGCGVRGAVLSCSPQKKIGKLVEFGIGVSIVVVLRGPPNPPALGSVQVRVGFRACILAPAGLRIACSIGVLYYGRRKRKPNPTADVHRLGEQLAGHFACASKRHSRRTARRSPI